MKRVQVAGGSEITIRVVGHTLVSTIDPHNWEVFYSGPNPQLRTRAEVSIDGQNVGSLADDSWMQVRLEKFGWHTISAIIYMKLKGGEEVVGCYKQGFEVNPLFWRSSTTPGNFWRVVIYASPCY